MTVCIAAIAENKDIIALTDKKFTVNHGMTSAYEITDNKKAIQLTPTCVALFAGNIVNANQLLVSAKKAIKDNDTVEAVAVKIQEAYNKRFREELDQVLFSKFGLDIDKFNAQQRTLDPTFVSSTIQTINNSNLGVEILIVGKDGATPRIFGLSIVGALEDNTSAGYVSIGSGASHAQLSLIESECHAGTSMESMIYALFKAKKRAEYDPGVGQMSNLVIVGDLIRFVEDPIVQKLLREYEESVKKVTLASAQSSKIMKGIIDDVNAK